MSCRPNHVFGKVVPAALALYVLFAYKVAIVDFAYRHLIHSERRRAWALAYAAPAHLLLLALLWAYLKVALSGVNPAMIGLQLPSPQSITPPGVEQRKVLFECDHEGRPLKCTRDSCDGRWKAPRTRHCGDCKACKPAFDHHCAWFNADVSAGPTMIYFHIFLALVSPLLVWALLPLCPLAYEHASALWRFGAAEPYIQEIWWNARWNWCGGPMFRFLIGFILAARHYPSNAAPVLVSRSDFLARAGLGLPALLAFALGFILIATGLLLSTLRSLSRGDLTIDVERRKLIARGAFIPTPKDALPPVLTFYWVPLPQSATQGEVVPVFLHERPFDLGDWRANLRAHLWPPSLWEPTPRFTETLQARATAQSQARARKEA